MQRVVRRMNFERAHLITFAALRATSAPFSVHPGNWSFSLHHSTSGLQLGSGPHKRCCLLLLAELQVQVARVRCPGAVSAGPGLPHVKSPSLTIHPAQAERDRASTTASTSMAVKFSASQVTRPTSDSAFAFAARPTCLDRWPMRHLSPEMRSN